MKTSIYIALSKTANLLCEGITDQSNLMLVKNRREETVLKVLIM